MPDTGAPWNIPYVAGTDLVSDWPTDSQTLAEAIADGLDDASVAGIGPNVVQAVKTDTFSTSSTSYTDVTGLTVTITPTSATSKILLIADLTVSANNSSVGVQFAGGNSANYTGDAAGSRGTGAEWSRTDGNFYVARTNLPNNLVYLDSPATTSATTYSVQIRVTSATGYVNQSLVDTDDTSHGRTASSLIAIEVAA